MEMPKITVPPDLKDLILSKGKEVMSPEGVPETVITSSTIVLTLTQGGKYRAYLLGRCDHVHSMGVYSDEKGGMEQLGILASIEGSMILEPSMMREIALARLRKGDSK